MAQKFNWALTPSNVANIGAIDDFYDLYVSIQELYESQRSAFMQEYEGRRLLWPDVWDDLCKMKVRQMCEPIMNKYLCVFADEYTKIFANKYGFDQFSFLRTKVIDKPNQPGAIQVRIISFADFLIEIQYAITRIIHRWKTNSQPKHEFKRVCHEINDHVLSYIHEHTVVNILDEEDSTAITNAILYIYENLSGISCYLKAHPIVAEKFVADFASGSGKLALPVHYCTKCSKYFIGKTTLALFEKNYGKLLIKRRALSIENDDFSGFNEESRLFQLGYNVSDGRSDAERQNLLVILLEKKYITYLDMTRCIELNIKLHHNKPVAVEKWKRDLKYIGDYIVRTKS